MRADTHEAASRPCLRCGHPTSGRRRAVPELCGPCALPYLDPPFPAKPVGWWGPAGGPTTAEIAGLA